VVEAVSSIKVAQMAAYVQVFGRRYDEPSTRSGGRRLKSAEARNRGK
jgi:hypothetical protein